MALILPVARRIRDANVTCLALAFSLLGPEENSPSLKLLRVRASQQGSKRQDTNNRPPKRKIVTGIRHERRARTSSLVPHVFRCHRVIWVVLSSLCLKPHLTSCTTPAAIRSPALSGTWPILAHPSRTPRIVSACTPEKKRGGKNDTREGGGRKNKKGVP